MQQSVPAKPDTYANRFKSLFSREQHPGSEKLSHNDEDDNDMVDLLDVMGKHIPLPIRIIH